MIVTQTRWTASGGWERPEEHAPTAPADLVLVFGARDALTDGTCLAELRRAHPLSPIFGCSTAGEIRGIEVTDDSVIATALTFESARIQAAVREVESAAESFAAGADLAAALEPVGLVHVFVLSDGLLVNGSELVRGLVSRLPAGVSVTGGLAGDGTRFEKTVVVCHGDARARAVVAIGLYGAGLRVGYASLGGWDPFGPERLVTRSRGNVLHELDGRAALELYRLYLGEHAADLPASGLLFPLSVRGVHGGTPVVRTILAVDEAAQTMTFAGDVPEGSYARLMEANFDRLIDGAIGAARTSRDALGAGSAELAILISCVGRKMVLKQRIEEEVEGVRHVVGEATALAGFYSYGEISPFTPEARCELHNQTMTITTLAEV